MSLTVSEVAKLSGVSVRTLHHYDDIGLLAPSYVGDNGYRYYEREALFRLQQILFHRDLGMPLDEIRRTLDDPDFDAVEALKKHRRRLEQDMSRYRQLIRTIDDTLSELRGEQQMENPFKGFSPEKQKAYEQELVDSYGEDAKRHIAESKANVARMSPAHHEAIKQEGHEVNLALMARIEAGDTPQADAVQALIARHHKWVSNYWVPNREAYIGLGQNYQNHPDFRAFYDKYDARLVDFLSEAMAVYAKANLE